MADDNTQSMPPATASLVQGQTLLPTQGWWRLWFYLFNTVVNLVSNSSLYLLVAGGQEIQGGFTLAEVELPDPANGATVVVNPSDGQKQTIYNNVAGFTIQATGEVGDVELRIVNGPAAGVITFAGFKFKYPGGSDLDTINGNEFIMYCFGFGAAGADYLIQARQ